MSLSKEAHALVLLADYIGVDAAGKINAIGACFALSGVQQTGLTAPQYVAAVVDVPGKYAGQELTLGLELRDEETGSAVTLPGPSGQLEAVRIQQVAVVHRPSVPGLHIPESVFCRLQSTVAFPNGLPLPSGRSYAWRLEIDGQHRDEWTARFHVPGPPPPPVFGGPAGPSDVPGTPSTP